ncbi:MAG: hypothetical protein IT384_13740 [Deltaproteobacteria bacterium]|nr:hypothetical protein [Deltaproteobacteria bacterium]
MNHSLPGTIDVLDRACTRIWSEIGTLLAARAELRARLDEPSSGAELERLNARLRELLRYSQLYRDIQRREAWARVGYGPPCGL